MSADAMARLREVLRVYDADPDDMGDYLVDMDDLRALLDAHNEKDRAHLSACLELEALRQAHDEALDALEAQEAYGCLCAMAEEGDPGMCGQCSMRHAVLAKAGRR